MADTNGTPHLSVVLPCYNEEQRLAESLPVILGYLRRQSYDWEIIVVDDGSRDRTSAVAESLADGAPLRVLRNEPNRGKGFSIRRGMLEARGRHRLFSDADLSTPIDELDKFWKPIAEGCAVVFGSRAMPDSQLEIRQSAMRELSGRCFNCMVRTLLLPGVSDTQCGFKMLTAEAADHVFNRQTLHGFAFDVEILLLARKAGFEIREVPVRWINAPGSKVSLFSGLRGFADLLALRLRR